MNSLTAQDGDAEWNENAGAEEVNNTLMEEQCVAPSKRKLIIPVTWCISRLCMQGEDAQFGLFTTH